jgi:hypothetical protein
MLFAFGGCAGLVVTPDARRAVVMAGAFGSPDASLGVAVAGAARQGS